METVIVLDTRPTRLLTTWSERKYKGRRDRGPNTHFLYADRTVNVRTGIMFHMKIMHKHKNKAVNYQ